MLLRLAFLFSAFLLLDLANAAALPHNDDNDLNAAPFLEVVPTPSCTKFEYRQSPINIMRADVSTTPMQPLQFRNYDAPTEKFTLQNTGYTLQLNTHIPSSAKLQLGGGNLYGWYDLLQCHFHWGPNDYEGSEHHIDGKSFPLEMHMVHIKAGHTDFLDMNEPDALQVVSVLFKLSIFDNPELELLLQDIDAIAIGPSNITLAKPITVANLLPNNPQHFWRYWGSLTTDPYAEEVVWTVLQDEGYVSPRQLRKLRRLHGNIGSNGGRRILSNFRPLQDLHGRTVYSNNFDTA